jgi:hypothetical protein
VIFSSVTACIGLSYDAGNAEKIWRASVSTRCTSIGLGPAAAAAPLPAAALAPAAAVTVGAATDPAAAFALALVAPAMLLPAAASIALSVCVLTGAALLHASETMETESAAGKRLRKHNRIESTPCVAKLRDAKETHARASASNSLQTRDVLRGTQSYIIDLRGRAIMSTPAQKPSNH